MGDLATTGSVGQQFANCIVTAGAKTGSAQTGEVMANGVFVCFAPFEEPEVAVAVVIEKGKAGAALASTAVEILNAYFAPPSAKSLSASARRIRLSSWQRRRHCPAGNFPWNSYSSGYSRYSENLHRLHCSGLPGPLSCS